MTSINPLSVTKNQINNGSLMALTKREWEVILHLSRGLTTLEIADKICVEPKSVDNYRGRIANKLGLKGRNKLARYSWMNKDILEEWYGLMNGKLSLH
jgi:DNA-binding NarL/FixJ family response regulator